MAIETGPSDATSLVHFVVVGYGEDDLHRTMKGIAPFARKHKANVVGIDTSVGCTLNDGSGINDAFEFSGYQRGLETVKGLALPADTPVKIVFVNSTVFAAHIAGVLSSFVDVVMNTDLMEHRRPAIAGFAWRSPASVELVAHKEFYFGTFALAIEAAGPAHLDHCCFYDRGLLGRAAFERAYQQLPASYQSYIDQWLSPKALLGGWYKASPFHQLSTAEMHRKRLAIYLEHTLLQRFESCGFRVLPLNLESTRAARAWIALVLGCDRFYVNLLKLGYRVRLLYRASLDRVRRA